jgi:threonine dehydratase
VDAAGTRQREVWADVVKGFSIALVVLWHVVQKHVGTLDWQGSAQVAVQRWDTLTVALIPLRLPLFFAVSGLFAANVLRRPWSAVLRTRAARFYWLFVVWVLIQAPLFAAFPDFTTGHVESWTDLLAQLTVRPPNVWYLYALALYFLAARAVRDLPPVAVLTGGLVLSVLAGAGLLPVVGNAQSVVQYFFFFLVGLYGPAVVRAVVAQAGIGRLALYTVLFGVGAVGVLAVGPGIERGVLAPWVSLAGLAFGFTLAALLAGRRWLGAPLAALGSRTLPVYVLHLPLVAALDAGVRHLELPRSWVVAGVYPVLAVLLVCAVCLPLEQLLRRLGLPWLFALPRPLVARWARAGERTEAPAVAAPHPHRPDGLR